MSGAHMMSKEWVLARVKPGQTVLDAGSGGGIIAHALATAGCRVFAVDLDPARASQRKADLIADLTDVPWKWAKSESYDAVVSTYCLQLLLGRETAAWAEIGRVLKKGGKLLATGRFRQNVPYFEWDRNDPLRGDNKDTIIGLCSASGLELVGWRTVFYTEYSYVDAGPDTANAWALEAVCTKGHRAR